MPSPSPAADPATLQLELLAAVNDALDLPPAAIDGDALTWRAILLEGRAAAVRDAIRTATALAYNPERVRREIDHLRVRVSQLPVVYRRYEADDMRLVCGDGCHSPVDGVHDSCPGPHADATVKDAR
jgi:hypothetical protein